MVDQGSPSFFGRVAAKVDSSFQSKFRVAGYFVGNRPCTSIMISLCVCLAMMSGISQLKSESRATKLFIPQDTEAQDDQTRYASYFPPTSRLNMIILEAKDSGSALDKSFLEGALALHTAIDQVVDDGNNLTSLCVLQPRDGHPCFINSILGTWSYDTATLANDNDPLARLNAGGMSEDDLRKSLGNPSFSGGQVTRADAMMLTYFLRDARVDSASEGYNSVVAEMWEGKMLELLKCDVPNCEGDVCACGYDSPHFKVYAQAQRSFSDAFGGVIRGDVGLINGAFMLMIMYLILNLGGVCNSVHQRALLAFACTLSIVVAGAAGYGMAMWLQFPYTPVHGVLPFVILGIGVDDSFVIMNAYDHTDPSLPIKERIAGAISHAGVSIMVTSLTDFVAFAISVSSALPALSSFCMYAALSILMLFFLQIFFFAALATLDARRVADRRFDCCFCCRSRKENTQICCTPPAHKGGRIGTLMEKYVGPAIVRPPVIAGIVAIFVGFCGVCCWQASMLAVQDTQRNFIPDDSYVATTLNKLDLYYSSNGQSVDIVTQSGDYYASQAGLTSLSTKLNALSFVKPTSSETFRSWAEAFKSDVAANRVSGVTAHDGAGIVTAEAEYYSGLDSWLSTMGGRYSSDIVWVDATNPQQGIKASKFSCEIKPVNKELSGRIIVDADKAIEVMDKMREAVKTWTDLPQPMAYTYNFLVWETFRIIKQEMYWSVGLCLVAVFIITLVTLAHPVTAILVFLAVVMTVIDILGCMNMWGLAIDNVSVIQLVIAVGLCVDYAAHVGHNFMLHHGTRAERVVATLGDVGAAVICGATSTFLGVMLLALSKSYVFRVLFQTFFLTVILGVAHGMILLPALLSLIGPDAYQPTEVQKVKDGETAESDVAQCA